MPVAALRHREAMPTTEKEKILVRTTTTRQLRDTPVDVKLVLCALWIAMLFVFAYVDILGFYRADVLDAALEGQVATTAFTVNQIFLTFTLVYTCYQP